MSFQMALFSFVGIELIGVTAGETKDPTKTIPKAINSVPIRILVFYVGALTVIMSIIPWNNINPEESPFVRLFALIGIPFAAGIINFVVLTAAASSCNSGIFSNSRMLFGLSNQKQAPLFLKNKQKWCASHSNLSLMCSIVNFSLIELYYSERNFSIHIYYNCFNSTIFSRLGFNYCCLH